MLMLPTTGINVEVLYFQYDRGFGGTPAAVLMRLLVLWWTRQLKTRKVATDQGFRVQNIE